jgi:serine/threonine protein kinase
MNLPTAFEKYLLIERLATGGMAEVFKAKAFGIAGFEKIVAIKRIHPHLSVDQEFVNMFIDEARIASDLSHPNIVQIFDLGKIDESYFIAMEYVDGITLERYIQDGKAEEKLMLSCYIIKEVAKALHHAHTKKAPDGADLNIVHRDISPQNILLSKDGIVKLTDFGVAKARTRISRTEPGMTKGKYPYMSPEQVMGKQIDHRSDIFSLSVVFYELLTGKMAFEGETEFEIMESIKKCEYIPPRKLSKIIPEELERIVIKGMQKNPAQRFNSAEEFSLGLSEFLQKNKFIEPQDSLKKLVNRIRGEEINSMDNKINVSTMILKPRKPARIQKLLIPGIAGVLILSSVTVYKYHRSTHSINHENQIKVKVQEESFQSNKGIVHTDPSQKIVNESEQKPLDSKVNINTVPWSYVYIDGKEIGETPLSGIILKPGEHQFTFKNPELNLHVTKTIRIEAGVEKTILENLKE